ncbi:hypothetical protein EHT87_09630 [Larkinella knui]|uniref:Uncharacterized protein n=2 Tax=Larkinella knui TaxID=2025310 RepID=A0A3P1CQV2_9BACT|nr:hypothetical protein EHT87_09630 [Larkinella knui]
MVVFGSLLAALLSLTVIGCIHEPSFPNSPQIEFQGFNRSTLKGGTGVGQQPRDSVLISITFKDGDEDLGNTLPLNAHDSAGYMQAGGWGNYKIRAFRLENNQYKEQSTGENNFLLFPRLSREGQKGPIEGTIDLKQIYYHGPSFKKYPTKYRIQIRDRALNGSNEIETDTISVPYPY